MKPIKSDIPQDVVEQVIQEYKQEGAHAYYRVTACVYSGEVVGQRSYDQNGQLVMETPFKNGKKHGYEYTWDEHGRLLLSEPYKDGQIHGTARQYGRRGQVIGTYQLNHGTGFDIWRAEGEDGKITISEIHSLQAGLPHGYEWWFGTESGSLWHERHWQNGQVHGIERQWNSSGTLRRGYPKYWVQGQRVTKRHYERAAQVDPRLPPFRREENLPRRIFPPVIEKLLSSR